MERLHKKLMGISASLFKLSLKNYVKYYIDRAHNNLKQITIKIVSLAVRRLKEI